MQSKVRIQLMSCLKRLLSSSHAGGAHSQHQPVLPQGRSYNSINLFLLSSSTSGLKNDLEHLIKWSQLNTDMHNDMHFKMKTARCAYKVGVLVQNYSELKWVLMVIVSRYTMEIHFRVNSRNTPK